MNIIYGPAGSGKTYTVARMAADDLAAGRHVTVIVPETKAVDTELSITGMAASRGISTIELDTVNFQRLENLVARREGGLVYNYLGRGGRTLLMWRAVSDSAGELRGIMQGEAKKKRFARGRLAGSDRDFIDMLLRISDELKTCGVGPDKLRRAAGMLDGSARLQAKLLDLALIFERYEELINNGYADPADDAGRLASMLAGSDYFSGTSVYIDGFASFSPVQYEIIGHIMDSDCSLCVTVPALPSPSNKTSPASEIPLRTAAKLKELAYRHGKPAFEDYLRTRPRFSSSPDLAALADALDGVTSGLKEPLTSLTAVSCLDCYEEAEFVARDIARRGRLSYEDGGERLRWRDFAVIARDVSKCEGVIDAYLGLYGIPYYMSVDTRPEARPTARIITAAIRVIAGNWRLGDVMFYLKTGELSGLDPESCGMIEEYAAKWNINGSKRWRGEWTMNPRGFETLTEDDIVELGELNSVRARLVAPLAAFEDRLGEQPEGDIRSMCACVWSLICDLDLPTKAGEAEREDPDGGHAAAYRSVINSLDQLVGLMGDIRADLDQLLSLLNLLISSDPSGALPQSADSVTVGSAGNFSAGGKKIVYIIGANDGVFPAAPGEDPLLGPADREKINSIKELDIDLSPTGPGRISEEQMLFYEALFSASGHATVCWRRFEGGKPASPSLPVSRILSISGIAPVNAGGIPAVDRVERPEPSLICAASEAGNEVGRALREIYGDYASSADPELSSLKGRLEAAFEPISPDADGLTPENAEIIYGPGDIYLSQSRLRRFAECPFRYTMTDVLELRDSRAAKFSSGDIGTLIHAVLEKFIASRMTADGGFDAEISDSGIDSEAERLTGETIDRIFSGGRRTKRINAMITRVRRTSAQLMRRLIEEFRVSDFRPRFLELPIGYGPKGVKAYRIDLGDGTDAVIAGFVDRVDAYTDNEKKITYFRVVDYKTGSESFSESGIERGTELQMPLYLTAVWRGSTESVRRGMGSGELKPAGIIYFLAHVSPENVSGPIDEAEIRKIAVRAVKADGAVLSDPDVAAAMAPEGSGYLPIKSKRYDESGLENICRRAEDKARELTIRMRNGDDSIAPVDLGGGMTPCSWCEAAEICRRARKNRR